MLKFALQGNSWLLKGGGGIFCFILFFYVHTVHKIRDFLSNSFLQSRQVLLEVLQNSDSNTLCKVWQVIQVEKVEKRFKCCVNSLCLLLIMFCMSGMSLAFCMCAWTNKPNQSLALAGTSNDNFKKKGGFSNESFSRVFTQKICVT